MCFSDILVVALANATIILIDITNRKIIRRFSNPENQRCVDLVSFFLNYF